MHMTATTATSYREGAMTSEQRMVIFASSLGTVFEWYDFYIYGTLGVFLAKYFFSNVPPNVGFIFALLAFAAGFAVRPFGALIFGRIGDMIGRKYTFLITMSLMGVGTFFIGVLPGYASWGIMAPIVLIGLRLVQGLALGGEYGGAAIYVAEHAPKNKRGFYTSWIQTTATVGLFMALLLILGIRTAMGEQAFGDWGWRIPFAASLILLVFSVYIRLKLQESPVFQKMKSEGKGSTQPLTDSFFKYPNNKFVLLALLGATAGQGVVWYTGQFYALFFLTITLKLDYVSAYTLIGLSLLIGTPFFIVFGWLSDKVGRLKIILLGCLIAAVTYFPLFAGLTHYVNPALEEFAAKTPITVAANGADCKFHLFVGPWSQFSNCDRVKDFLTKQGLSFKSVPAVPGKDVVTTIGTTKVEGWDQKQLTDVLKQSGYPGGADKAKVNWVMTEIILVIMVIYVTMVYGPIAAFLVELFPTKIRYTSMSLPYHIGNGWFGGMLPLTATALVAATGDIYFGLWYPIIVALMTLVIGGFFLTETRHRDIRTYDHHQLTP